MSIMETIVGTVVKLTGHHGKGTVAATSDDGARLPRSVLNGGGGSNTATPEQYCAGKNGPYYYYPLWWAPGYVGVYQCVWGGAQFRYAYRAY